MSSFCSNSFFIPKSEMETILEFVINGNYEGISQKEEWSKMQTEKKLQCSILLNISSEDELLSPSIEKICNILNVKVQK